MTRCDPNEQQASNLTTFPHPLLTTSTCIQPLLDTDKLDERLRLAPLKTLLAIMAVHLDQPRVALMSCLTRIHRYLIEHHIKPTSDALVPQNSRWLIPRRPSWIITRSMCIASWSTLTSNSWNNPLEMPVSLATHEHSNRLRSHNIPICQQHN